MSTDPRSRPRCQPAVIELLEPRLLLSADLPVLLDPGDPGPDAEAPPSHVRILEGESAVRDPQRFEVVFVDAGIDGYERLIEGILLEAERDATRRFEVVVLDESYDGVAQISETLASMHDVDAVHVLSHGDDGGLRLGDAWLSSETLDSFAVRIKGWRDAFAEGGDLLFYGCDLAAGEDGRSLTRELARLTGADVAASDDPTGSALLGGDWLLEHRVGPVESALAVGADTRQAFSQVLADNLPPLNTLPGSQTVDQDGSLVFSTGNGNLIAVSDPDLAGGDIQVSLSVDYGTITLSRTNFLTFSDGDGTADTSMTFSGAVDRVNSALNRMQYDPDPGWSGSAMLTLTSDDRGQNGDVPLDGDPDQVARYRFALDGSDDIGSNDATLRYGASVVSDPERGNVLRTDGWDDYAELPTALTAGLSEYSFSLWIRTTENGSDTTYYERPTFFGMIGPSIGDGDMILTTNNGYVGFWTGRSGDSVIYQSSTTRINDDQWHLITVTDDGATASLYVDGAFEASLASGPMPLLAQPYRIGAANSTTGSTPANHHQGYYDDVRIFDRALSASEAADLYGLRDTDTLAITVTPANTAPLLTANGLSIEEAQTVVLTAADLAATDAETPDAGLAFTVSNVLHGHFELSGTPVSSFLQSDVTAGNVSFVHDGGELAPSYDVEVGDGELTTAPVAATITFTASQSDPPVLVDNDLGLTEGQTVLVTPMNLSATDPDSFHSTLVFQMSDVTGGHFELSGTPTTSFTQGELVDGLVTFVHDGGEAAPAYQVAVSDGVLSSAPAAATIAFTSQNDAPVLQVPSSETTDEGMPLVFSTADGNVISVGDPDSATLTVSLSSANGSFTLAQTTGLVFGLGSGNGDASVRFAGTPTQLNAALDGMRFLPNLGFQGTASVQVAVSDGTLARSGSISIEVAPLLDELGPGSLSSAALRELAPEPSADPEPVRESGSQPVESDASEPVATRVDLAGFRPGGIPVGQGDDGGLRLGGLPPAEALLGERIELGSLEPVDGRRDASEGSDPVRWSPRGLETQLWQALDRMRDDVMEDLRRDTRADEALVTRAESVAILVSVSVLAGLLRSSSLFALSLSSLPLWMRMDPLAVLSLSNDERRQRARELERAEHEEDRRTGVSRVLRSARRVV